jgi:hypothetical protein
MLIHGDQLTFFFLKEFARCFIEAKFLSPVKVTFFSYIVGEKQEQDMHHCK